MLEWSEVAGHLTGLAHIATASADGEPHVAVVAPLVEDHDGASVVWICTNRGSRKARNLAANPRIALVWRPGAEVYIQGVATLVDDPAEKARIWRSGALSFDPAAFFGSPDNPEFVLVRVRPERAVVLGPGGPSTWRAATGSG